MKETSYNWPANIKAPVCEIKSTPLTAHGDTRTDNYYWLNDYFKKGPDSTKVVDYLLAENKYYDTMMSGTKTLQEKLYTEMKARIKEKDESVPSFKQGYFYYSRQVEGKDYFVYCRKKGTLDAAEEVLLDVNALAEGHNYFSARGFAISMDNNLMAYGIDMLSRREYTIYIKNLQTGETYKDAITGTEGDPVWANDNQSIFYAAKNPVTLLSEKIKKHVLGTAAATDKIVYQEKDPSNYIGVSKTKSDKYILITSQATLSSEIKWIDASKPNDAFAVFQPRIKEVLYDVDHANDRFYIRTNLHAKNFNIVTCTEDKKDSTNWKDLLPHSDSILVQAFELFKNFMAVSERINGLTQIHIINLKDNTGYYLAFDEPAYTASIGANPDFNTDVLRFNYTSLTTPVSVYDYNMVNKEKKLMKQQEVLGGFKVADYTTERAFATAKDGTKIPLSIVYKKGFNKNGNAPLLLYAYGSYGISTDAAFSSVRLSLLNRGFAFAIAHIRGGEEMGRYWYEDGKTMKKKNTFNDFIDCAQWLLDNKYTSTKHLYINGGSAGGLLMGAVVNMRPDLWNGVIAAVPFVDVVTTMSDPTIPLTTNEYDEWGNPANKESYDYMKSYSPYDNVEKKAYPNMLVTTGLHDSQVQYFEPAKWVAKLRAMKTDSNKLFLYTNMEAGHGGASGRFKPLKDKAREYAFFLALEGIAE
ncbi:S9 family peptidase [Ferruginibacter sp.]|uniref:S9 family peptidase n=1 Tax=Ferruginibacter sp. TaxID=1940288 RepID=UPI00265B6DD6|nr:S9 family peptidase [Ferruginibacter sp.]